MPRTKSQSRRPLAGMFQGLNPMSTLGGLKIVGKEFGDYKIQEIAYIIAQYMVQYQEGGKYSGTFTGVVRRLWPDDYEKLNEKQLRALRHIIRNQGFRHGIDNYGMDYWSVPTRLVQKDFLNSKMDYVHRPSGPVTYKCWYCKDNSPVFEKKEELDEHLRKEHEMATAVVETVEEKSKPVPLRADVKIICDVCNKPFSEKVYIAHRQLHEMGTCNICGKQVINTGLGAHKKSHTLSPYENECWNVIDKTPGLHARDYARLLGWIPSKVSRIANALVRKGKIFVVGQRTLAKYFPTDFDRETAQKLVAADMSPQTAAKYGWNEAKETPAEPKPEAKSWAVFEEAKIFEDENGIEFTIKNGNLYRVFTMRVS